ncbi:hypothetical protein SAMN02745824_0262 [Parasphingorhabdus marina DSM 22363]|uniref:Uncharacterized protein n=1 Tax=Parasphingorhabdus marina DSM 22363 TaxID=1123272 RepID=A0A1N6CMK1_9SPHN|nr:hypothetical protein SAMN02745824_0262 [Parasphingorhabdus marina DSM 22363]
MVQTNREISGENLIANKWQSKEMSCHMMHFKQDKLMLIVCWRGSIMVAKSFTIFV